LTMFKADQDLGRVSFDFTRPEDANTIGINKDRLNDYRNHFNLLGLKAGIEGYDDKSTIWFHYSTHGLSVSGSSKGYAYIEDPPAIVVDNLDSYSSKDGRSFSAFRRIEGKWYLYFDFED
jgi:hypothetical protein